MKFIRTIACLATLALFSSCGTTTPDPQPLDSVVVSYDGNVANGGVMRVQITDGDSKALATKDVSTAEARHGVTQMIRHGESLSGLVLTPDARERFNRLLQRYGCEVYGREYPDDYGLIEQSDGCYLASRESSEMFAVLNQVWKMDGCPTK